MSIVSLPLSKLVPSPVNVRKVGGTTIDDLAASIAAHGLIQSLTVRAAAGSKFEVVAGGRRLAALKRLAKDKRLPKGYAVPCRVLDGEDATEISLAENIIRQAMHPADQFDAFHALADQGLCPADIAARFGAREETVLQRLKLAAVSPRLMAIYREDGMTLEQLMAFTLTDDPAVQEAAWFEAAYDWQRQPRALRQRLIETKVAASDARVQLIGLDAYLAAGGTVTRDLFASEDGSYLDDPALLETLVTQHLGTLAGELRAEGWGWVEVMGEPCWPAERGWHVLTPPQRPFSAEAQAERDRLVAAYDALAEGLEDGDDDERLHRELDALDEAIGALDQEDRTDWSGIDKADAGAVVAFDRTGRLQMLRGLVTTPPADTAAAPVPKEKPAFPAALLQDLSAERTLALRIALARQPAVAFDALLWTLAARTFGQGRAADGVLKLQLEGSFAGQHRQADTPAALALRALREHWEETLPASPDGLWDWLRAADLPTKLGLLAVLLADGLQAVQERGQPAPWQAGALHTALGLDLADWWQPDTAFLSRLSKAQIIDALRETGANPHTLAACTGKKKGVLVTEAVKALEGTRWLPAPLRAPQPDVTAEAMAA